MVYLQGNLFHGKFSLKDLAKMFRVADQANDWFDYLLTIRPIERYI